MSYCAPGNVNQNDGRTWFEDCASVNYNVTCDVRMFCEGHTYIVVFVKEILFENGETCGEPSIMQPHDGRCYE